MATKTTRKARTRRTPSERTAHLATTATRALASLGAALFESGADAETISEVSQIHRQMVDLSSRLNSTPGA